MIFNYCFYSGRISTGYILNRDRKQVDESTMTEDKEHYMEGRKRMHKNVL